MPDQKAPERPARDARCPICGAPTEHAWRPFCSRRCADVDLGRWLKGAYAIPAGPPEAEEDGAPSGDGAGETPREPSDGRGSR